MSGLWSRVRTLWGRGTLWGSRGALRTRARAAEAKGDLGRALQLYVDAGLDDDARRLLISRSERARDPLERLELLGRARDFSTGEARERLSRRTAEFRLELCKTHLLRLTASELDVLANELTRLGSPALAAEAHALAGNVEDQARALVEAGAIERLEAVLDADREQNELEARRQERALEAHDLEQSGRRREALELAGEAGATDPTLRELSRRIEQRRVLGARVVLELGGRRRKFVLGDEVTVGRSGATLQIPSPAISRSHLSLSRDEAGPRVRDTSRNGTTLNGVVVDTTLHVRDALSLELGGEVVVRLVPDPEYCLRVELLDQVWFAPLGDLSTPVGNLRPHPDGWLELLPGNREVYLSGSRVLHPVQLCRGDRFALSREGPIVLGVES